MRPGRARLLFVAAFVAWLTARLSRNRERGRARARRDVRPPPRSQWDIAPGETLLPHGRRDLVAEASMESFPASDPPAIGGG